MKKIYVAGHRGMVGSAVCRALASKDSSIGECEIIVRTHSELDLLDSAAVRAFYEKERPDIAIIAAARVGGELPEAAHLQQVPAGIHGVAAGAGAAVVADADAAVRARLNDDVPVVIKRKRDAQTRFFQGFGRCFNLS